MTTYPDLESNPTATTVLYLNFEGCHLSTSSLIENKAHNECVSQMNYANVDAVPLAEQRPIDPFYEKILGPNHPFITTYNKRLEDLYVPPLNVYGQYSNGDLEDIWAYVSLGLQPFNINVTTKKSVYENAAGRRFMSIITTKPNGSICYHPFNWGDDLGIPEDGGLSLRRFMAGASRWAVVGQTYIALTPPAPINFIFDCAFTLVVQRNVKPDGKVVIREVSNKDKAYFTKEGISSTILHEFSHFINNGNGIKIDHDGQGQEQYYLGHNKWFPIMGSRAGTEVEVHGFTNLNARILNKDMALPFVESKSQGTIQQWSKGEYKGATSQIDDINILGNTFEWIKKPLNGKNPPSYKKSVDGIRKARTILKDDFKILTDNVYQNIGGFSDFVKTIEGVIGYSYDFDILKILLKKGRYKFVIETPNTSHLDAKIEILNCSCEEKSKSKPNCNKKVGDVFPKNIDDRFTCIKYKDQDIYEAGFLEFEEFSSRGYAAVVNLEYSTVIYLKISGNKKPDVEPPDPDSGYTPYGSIGKYFLQIFHDGGISQSFADGNAEFLLNTTLPPEARCERVNVCINNSFEELDLFVQDTHMKANGNNTTGLHTLKLSTIVDGKIKSNNFLVYGQPIDKDATEEPGKLYLKVLIDGVCKKQEFIVGLNKNESST